MSTVRAMAIAKPEIVEVENEDGYVTLERWPKRPLIVSGSRDHSLRVWTLPKTGEPEYKGDLGDEVVCHFIVPSHRVTQLTIVQNAGDNPYHKLLLEGHDHAVRGLAVHGRTAVSGSYDTTVRVWDIINGDCKFVLTGHTQKGSVRLPFRPLPWSDSCS